MQDRAWEIYTLTDPRTGAVRYVGVTFRGRRRLNEHLSRATTGGRTHRDCWIRSLIGQGLRPMFAVIERGRGDGWQERERAQIAEHRQSSDLVNLTEGGEGVPGYVPTPALRQKWSEMRAGVEYAAGRIGPMTGRSHTPEAIERIRAASAGRTQTPETRARVSAARSGKPLSDAHRQRLSEAHRGKKLAASHRAKIAASTTGRRAVVCEETGQQYASITEAARALGVTEASVNQAVRKGGRCRGNRYRLA